MAPIRAGLAAFALAACDDAAEAPARMCEEIEAPARIGDDLGPPLGPAAGRGSIATSVTTRMVFPAGNAWDDVACDLDYDGDHENAIGWALALWSSDCLQGEADRGAGQGDAALLWGLQANSYQRDVEADLQAWAGGERDDAFAAARDATAGPALRGSIIGGIGEFGPGPLPLVVRVAGRARRIPLAAARVRGALGPDGAVRAAVLCGGVPADAMDEVLIPALGDAFRCAVRTKEGHDLLLGVYDDDQDGTIEDDELRASDLLRSLLRPDLDLFAGDPRDRVRGSDCRFLRCDDGQRMVEDPACMDAVSLAVAIRTEPAAFEVP